MRSTNFIVALAVVAVLAATTPAAALFEGTFTASTCIAGKLGCIEKMKSCLLACHEKALRSGLPVDPACLTSCRSRFALAPAVPGKGCFAKAEAKGDCGASLGDTAATGARVDAYVDELVRTLVPHGSIPANPCTSKKLTCVRKYDTCVLKLARKAAQTGTALGDVSKCARYLDGSDKSCVGKLETRYCSPGGLGCESTEPACQTFADEGVIRLRDDAFVDETIFGLVAGPRDVDTQRCSGDTAVTCTSAPGGVADCGGPLGTCEFFFGAPVPQGWGGVQVCTSTQWKGAVSGTLNTASGASTGSAAVLSRYYIGLSLEQPCPRCAADPIPNDGIAAGTCQFGAHNGAPCDANEAWPQPTFGSTSLDCPPTTASLLGSASLAFEISNDGAATKTVGATSPTCNGAPGKKCLCASCSGDSSIACENDAQCATAGAGTCTSNAGEPRRPNACVDFTSVPGDGTICADAGNGDGVCPESPPDSHCAIETFRSCLLDSDCPAPHDQCVIVGRPCFLGYDGEVGDTVSAVGRHDAPRNDAGATTFAAVFCHPPTSHSAVNTVMGAPGPGRLQLTGVVENDGGPSCPTRASFVPTSKGPATDLGWQGIVHGQPRIGGAKVSVTASCSGTYPDCSCTYTGPIANPDAP